MGDPTGHEERILDQFSRQAESYGRLTADMARSRAGQWDALSAQLQLAADDRLLDVCCGPGSATLGLAGHVGQATGMDLTPAMLDEARAAQAGLGLGNVEWVNGDIYRMPFDDASFSVVYCSAAFHHLVDPGDAFAEMVRVCRPGGRIAIRDVTPAAARSAAYDGFERLRDPSHVHALTPEELASLGSGLAVAPPELHSFAAADLPFDAVLATSFPESSTVEDLRRMMRDDALAGGDRFGFSARIVEGEVRVSYPQTMAVWLRLG